MRTRDACVMALGAMLMLAGIGIAMPTEDLRRIMIGTTLVWIGAGIIIAFGPRLSS